MSEFGMSKMENNEIMDTNMEDVKMRSVEELIHNNISREDMTKEEEKTFVEYWFNKYEEEGFLEKFHVVYGGMDDYKGKKFKVLSRCKEGTFWDLETLPAWNIEFEDGEKLEAYPEEICKLERN